MLAGALAWCAVMVGACGGAASDGEPEPDGVAGGGVIGFDVRKTMPEQLVRRSSVANGAWVRTGDPLSLRFQAENAAGGAGGVNAVQLKSLALLITTSAEPPGDSDCWDFLSSVRVSIESTRAGTQLARREIAAVGQAGCTRVLEIAPVEGVDLKPYADEGYRVIFEAQGVIPPDDVSFDGTVVLYARVL